MTSSGLSSAFANVYDDPHRAAAYARLGFPGTYYLAFRGLKEVIAEHVTGTRALDFGCGAGRSTRFLKQLGFDAMGIDISGSMIELAVQADPDGDYHCVREGELGGAPRGSFDLVQCAFTFDNIPGLEMRRALLRDLKALLKPTGRIVLLGSTPEIYWHEWASFTTQDFPENRGAASGGPVRIIMKDVGDQRPVLDLIWYQEDYLALFEAAGLELVATSRPLGRADEPCTWLSEATVPPWVIYVLKP